MALLTNSLAVTGVLKVSEGIERAKEKAKLAHHQAILEKSAEVDEKKREYQEAKDIALGAKKAFDNVNSELLNLIRKGPEKQLSLFQVADKVPEEPAWRSVPVSSLDIVSTIKAKLDEAKVFTLGDVDDVEQRKRDEFPKGLRSLKLSAAQVSKLNSAVDKIKDGCKKDATEKPVAAAAKPESVDSDADFESELEATELGLDDDVAPEAVQDEVEEASAEVGETEATEEVEEVESPVAEEQVEDTESSGAADAEVESGRVKIRLTMDLDGLQDVGFTKGAIFLGEPNDDDMVIMTEDGSAMVIHANEFEIVGGSKAKAS